MARLEDFPGADPADPAEVLTLKCDILVPAALERVIHGGNAGKLRCRVLAEGANGPTTPEADAILADSDIFIIPDILCNAGGVTVSYFEWVQDLQQFMWGEDQVNAQLRKLMLGAFRRVRERATKHGLSNRLVGGGSLSYGEMPGFPEATVAGHAGVLSWGRLGADGPGVIVARGRFHLYEGHGVGEQKRPRSRDV